MLLYYITDRKQFPGAESARQERLLECVEAAAHAGVDYIQLREKDLPMDALEALARAAQERVAGRARLLINSHCNLAAEVGAAGVHLPAGSAIAPVRAGLLERGVVAPIIGVSCHTSNEVVRAHQAGADFAVFGPVFEKIGFEKDGSAGVGLERLAQACAAAGSWPVLALGGVTPENAAECIGAGAAGVAGIRMFQTGDLSRTTATLRRLAP